MRSWHDAKVFVEHASSISHDALHILAGTAAWLAFAVILRRSLTAWMPLLATFCLILLNEAVDLWVEIWPQAAMQLGEGAKDLGTTMAVPAMMILTMRTIPALTRSVPARGNRSRR